jgi:hypothetical protein
VTEKLEALTERARAENVELTSVEKPAVAPDKSLGHLARRPGQREPIHHLLRDQPGHLFPTARVRGRRQLMRPGTKVIHP